jgi:Mlc titration factor MtfA (ptsG expression regulator)
LFLRFRQLWNRYFPIPVEEETNKLLEKHSAYYKGLALEEKQRFAARVVLFLKFIRFEGGRNFQVTREMKLIIAAAAIQVTFGLKRYIFHFFRRIIIQPDLYRIPEYNENLLGHVDKTRRTITLSWPNTEYGFMVPNDAHNVALHEIAHVILFENSLRSRVNEFFSRPHWDHWLEKAEPQFILNQHRKNVLLKEYADNNLMEMFAVSIETFFEQSQQFKKSLPELYSALVQLLQQDPSNPIDPRSLQSRAKESES